MNEESFSSPRFSEFYSLLPNILLMVPSWFYPEYSLILKTSVLFSFLSICPSQVTVKEQQEWRIPPCVSNWKNAKGYTIPLDKRLAADGRGLQSVHINEKFAKLAEALYIADRKAREQVSHCILCGIPLFKFYSW